MNELFDFNIDIADIDIDMNMSGMQTRYIKPKVEDEIKEEHLRYSKAQDLADKIDIVDNFRLYCFVSGSFYFGDFIEAMIIDKGLDVKRLTVSTLSMNENNVDSLANIMNGGYCEKLNLIISHYFYSHERQTLVPYIYQELDKNNRFQMVVCRSHCKIALIELKSGHKIVIHGSANLRSSGNVEQIMIEENKALYDFNYEYQRTMIKRYKTIEKES